MRDQTQAGHAGEQWHAGKPTDVDRAANPATKYANVNGAAGSAEKHADSDRAANPATRHANVDGAAGSAEKPAEPTAKQRVPMKVFRGFEALPRFTRPTVTVGSYDGVHSGHLALLRTVTDTARAQGGDSIVLTFEPHPRITLGKAEGLRLLTTAEEKVYLLDRLGIGNLIVIPFDKAFSALSPDAFIRDYLVGRLGAETLVVGFNHRFGRDKQGSYDYLGSHGFGLRVVEVGECDVDALKVSSTVVRGLVAQGDMARAARLLAHPYLMIGTAEQGRIRIDEPLKLLPPPGEYDIDADGRPARLTVDASQNLIIHGGCSDGRVVLTFR